MKWTYFLRMLRCFQPKMIYQRHQGAMQTTDCVGSGPGTGGVVVIIAKVPFLRMVMSKESEIRCAGITFSRTNDAALPVPAPKRTPNEPETRENNNKKT